jgi:OOP family OmpA-OmpF porin
MKKILVIALLSATAATAATAFAADSGFYAGVNLGQSRSGNPQPSTPQTKSSDTAVGVLAGYQFGKNWGAEAFYTDAGKYQDADNGGSISGKTSALGLAAVGTLPLSDAFSLYAKLGYARTKGNSAYTAAPGSKNQSLDLGSTTRSAPTYGLGGVYNVSSAVGIRFGWDRYGAASRDTNDGVNFFATNYNVDVYSLGAVFKF